MSNLHPDVPERERFGCSRSVDCVAGNHHVDEACVTSRRWDGMPDPHRHNPFVVGLALVVIVTLGYAACAVLVLALVSGWRP